MKFAFISVFLAGFVMIGCSKKAVPLESVSPLDGTWSRSCEAESPESSMVSKLKFQKNELIANYQFFSDSFCAPEFINFEIKTTGQTAIGAKAASANANEINLTGFRTFLTIKSDLFVSAANSTNLFGFNNWTKDTEKEITGKNADGDVDFSAPAKAFDIFSASNSVLCFGLSEKDKDGSTTAKRPTKIDTECFFKGELIPASYTPKNTLAALSGTWTTKECEEDDGSSSITAFNISGSTGTLVTSYFSDTECSSENELADLKIIYSLEVGSNTLQPAGATEINFLTPQVFLTPQSESQVIALNNGNLYGFSDWALNTEKEITGKNEDGSADTTTNVYSIFKIIGNSLCFGVEVNDSDTIGNSENDDGTAPAKRHTYLDNRCLEAAPVAN